MADSATACLIDAETTVRGTLAGNGPVEIVGRVQGQVLIDDEVWVRPGGQVQADVRAGALRLEGDLAGDVVVEGHLEVLPGAHLAGTLRAQTFSLAAEAAVQASIEMDLSLPSELS